MNRQERITGIQNKINKFYKNNVCTENERQLLSEIFDEVEILRQPITLTEFLGWEEDVVYTNGKFNYKIKRDSLFCYVNGRWGLSGYNYDFKEMYKFRDFVEVEK